MNNDNIVTNTELGTHVNSEAEDSVLNLKKTVELEKKYVRIIAEQSDQMLFLVDISNAHTNENTRLQNIIKDMHYENDELKESFNLQMLLFVLLVLVLFYVLKH